MPYRDPIIAAVLKDMIKGTKCVYNTPRHSQILACYHIAVLYSVAHSV